MKISNAFPSDYLKAADLQGGRYTMTISQVTIEKISETENKPVIHFHNTNKGMVLNKTNAMNLTILYGDETDNWIGKQIELFTTVVPFQGQNVQAIRLTAPPAQQAAAPIQQTTAPAPQPAPAANPMASQPLPDGRPTAPPVSGMGGPLDDDEIPF